MGRPTIQHRLIRSAQSSKDWPFLAVMPPMLAEAVDSLEDEYKN